MTIPAHAVRCLISACAAWLVIGLASGQTDPLKWGEPSACDHLLKSPCYAACFSAQYNQPLWVAYTLTGERVKHAPANTSLSTLVSDTTIAHGPQPSDYENSGYDPGPLAPAADMDSTAKCRSESNRLSGACPQNPTFRLGVWRELEERVRQWAVEFGTVDVVSGPVLREGLPTIGARHVAVPEYFYKVILAVKDQRPRAVGFILKNDSTRQSLMARAFSVDSVQTLTGLNFFNGVPETAQYDAEHYVNLGEWFK